MTYQRSFVTALIFCALMPARVAAGEQQLDWNEWLNETVVYIISDHERQVFLKLETEEQRQRFREHFWLQRDPTRGTERNEFREEHFRRLEHANRFFGRDTSRPGWKTDRGRMYILLGEPKTVDRWPSTTSLYPLELWFYQSEHKGLLPNFFRLIFFRPNNIGEMILYTPGRHLPSHLVAGAQYGENVFRDLANVSPEIAMAAAGIAADEPPFYDPVQPNLRSLQVLAQIEDLKNNLVDPGWADALLTGETDITTDYAFVDYQIHRALCTSVDTTGIMYLHVAMQLPTEALDVGQYDQTVYGAWTVELLLANQKGETLLQHKLPFELEIDRQKFEELSNRRIGVRTQLATVPGTYTLTVRIRNEVSRVENRFTETIDVETEGGLKLGLPVIAQSASNLNSERARTWQPFEISNLQLQPGLGNLSTQSDQAVLFCPVSGLGAGQFEASYQLDITMADGRHIGSTDGVLRSWQADDGGNTHFITGIPTDKLPPGTYTIALTMKQNGQSVQRRLPLAVTDEPVAQWYWLKTRVDNQPQDRILQLADMLVRQDLPDLAVRLFARAADVQPLHSDTVVRYAELLIRSGRNDEALQLLRSSLIEQPDRLDMIKLAAQAHQSAGDYRAAIKLLQRSRFAGTIDTEGLNMLAGLLMLMDERKEAETVFRESLQMEPDQPAVQEKLKQLQGATSLR